MIKKETQQEVLTHFIGRFRDRSYRFIRLIELGAPTTIVQNEIKLLDEAILLCEAFYRIGQIDTEIKNLNNEVQNETI